MRGGRERLRSLIDAAKKADLCSRKGGEGRGYDHGRYELTLGGAGDGERCRVVLWDYELWFQTGDFWPLLKLLSADAALAARPVALSGFPGR